MTTQSIIVYRNPVEAAFWESGMIFPLMGGLGVGFIAFLILMRIAEMTIGDHRINNLVIGGAAIASMCAGALTFHWLFI